MEIEKLKAIIEKHRLYKIGNPDGERADLSGADLSGADLRGADLSGANLGGANLGGAYLGGAYLGGANLSGANLSGAYLSGAYLGDADLSGADLGDADLSGANLRRADLSDIKITHAIGNMVDVYSMQCDTWMVCWTSKILSIGCESHLIEDWWDFNDDQIVCMDSDALDWWRKWRDILRAVVEKSLEDK